MGVLNSTDVYNLLYIRCTSNCTLHTTYSCVKGCTRKTHFKISLTKQDQQNSRFDDSTSQICIVNFESSKAFLFLYSDEIVLKLRGVAAVLKLSYFYLFAATACVCHISFLFC